jgi:transposase-like protein
MPAALFDKEQKERAMTLIREGILSVMEISRETGIKDKNISRWKSEFEGGGNGNGRRRRRRREVEPEKPVDWKLSFELKDLESSYLRRGVDESWEARLKLEILYLRERAQMFGDDTLTPLFYVATETPETSGD